MPRSMWILAPLLALACTPTTPAPAVDPTAPPHLELALPAGVTVTVDGVERGATPLDLELEAGAHALTLATRCATAELEVALAAGKTTRVEPDDVPTLGFATLVVTARGLDGKALVHSLSVDEAVAARGQQTEVTISACGHRIDVASEGLGGWTEHVAFTRDQRVTRDVTLSLGPDMVRIPGGHFRMGPPGPSRYIPGLGGSTEDLEDHERQGWPWVHPFEVDVPTIDVDRTEVTAAQFHACRQSGQCPWEAMQLRYVDYPPERDIHLCTTDGRQHRKPLPGKEDHPVNCIPRFEAETYCAAVGKRLPTDAEFEHAARGGRAENYCPWGPMSELEEEGRGSCVKRHDIFSTHPVCSHPEENSLHGLCDMAGSVSEFIMWTEGREAVIEPETPDGGGTVFVLTRGGLLVTFEDGFTPLLAESVIVGFRCVRDVAPPGGRDGE